MASPKVVLVTGGNDEIGYGAVKVFLESDKAYHVLLGSLSLEKGKAAIKKPGKESPGVTNTVEVVQVDLHSDESTRRLSRKSRPVQGASTLLTTLSADPLLIFVAGLSQISVVNVKYFPTPPLPAGWPKKVDFETIGYRSSKTALNMVMLDWNHKLKEAGVKVWGVGHEFLATTEKHSRQCIGHWGWASEHWWEDDQVLWRERGMLTWGRLLASSMMARAGLSHFEWDKTDHRYETPSVVKKQQNCLAANYRSMKGSYG